MNGRGFRTQFGSLLASLSPAARQVAGRRYWLVPLLPLLWPILLYVLQFTSRDSSGYSAAGAQGLLLGLPLSAVGVFLGIRVIAGEIDHRTLEIAYTVPGGAYRIWTSKLVAAALLIAMAALLLAGAVFVLLTDFPLEALYSAYQTALVFLVLATGFGALFKGGISGALAAAAVLILAFVFSTLAFSPFWSPLFEPGKDAAALQATWIKNRIGYLLLIGVLTALAFSRAERREKMLGG